jgi:hypothetical protein
MMKKYGFGRPFNNGSSGSGSATLIKNDPRGQREGSQSTLYILINTSKDDI